MSGKDSLAATLVQLQRRPDLPYEFLFCDVEMELPETYAWLDRVERTLGVVLTRVGKSLETIIDEQGILPSSQIRFCTKYGKIFPIREYLGDGEAVQYIELRADEGDRADSFRPTENVTACFPLIEEGVDLRGVYRMLDERQLLPPNFFWQRLYDAVLPALGPASRRYVESLQPWQVASLFSWRSRSNCFMCFYQRLYEWVGLLEHHPDLYERSEKLEADYGGVTDVGRNQDRVKIYTLRPDGPLRQIRARAESIFKQRVQKVIKTIVEMRHNPDDDPMSQTSCGVYCGN